MDQVKEYLAVAMKHAFWIGTGIVLLGTVGIWYMSVSSLDSVIQTQEGKITGYFSTVDRYRGEIPEQPNDFSHVKMDELIEGRKTEVLQAWQTVFDAQRDILTWPTKLKDEFINEFKYVKDPETGKFDMDTLKLPFEKYEEFSPTVPSDIPPNYLRRYEQYIGEVLPSYAAIAGANWTASFTRARQAGMDSTSMMMGYGSAMAGGQRKEVDITGVVKEPLVRWSTASQDSVLADLFPWRGKKEYPSELDVYYSQENLWILRQLLQIVSAVNGDANQAFEAKIREIKKIQIGRAVSFAEGQISEPGSRVTAGFGGEGYDSMMMGDDSGMDMYSDDGSGGGAVIDTTDPGDDRYVNTAFEPITASALRSAFSSEDPGSVAIAVAKRVPVMIQFQIDQRAVPELLAACGSAPLMVDVYQTRVMPKGGRSSGGGGMMGMDEEGGDGGDEGYGGMGGMMGMGGGGMMGMGGGGGTSSVRPGAEDDYPLDLDVEIYGLIYFYNPPNEQALGIEKITDDVSIDESAETIESLPVPDTTPPADATPDPANATPGPAGTTPDPANANPAPANPAPANPNPAPANPAPANPAPANPNPAPAGPAPANPNPANPAPANGGSQPVAP